MIRRSVAVEFGPGGNERIVAGADDFVIVPANTVHRELTGDGSNLEAFVVRVGGEPEEVAVGGPGTGRRRVADRAGPIPR